MNPTNTIDASELRRLASHSQPHSVSVLMPAERAAPKTRQNPIRLKNLLGEAEEQLAAAGATETEVEARLDPLRSLLYDEALWQHRCDGLAIFAANGDPHIYRVPLALDELVVVAERFHVKPLFDLADDGTRFYILALSQTSVRFFEASRHDVREVELRDVPGSLEEAMCFVDAEKHLGFHTGTPTQGKAGKRPAMFHGQGVGKDDAWRKTRLLDYCRMIDDGIHKRLREENAPLLLAGNEPLLSVFREANSYGHLHENAVLGNPEQARPEDLHQQALGLLSGSLADARDRDRVRYHQRAGSEEASDDLDVVLRAAHLRGVDTLFVAIDEDAWGKLDPATGRAEIHAAREAGDEDLLNLAAVRTLRDGGTVHAVPRTEVPGARRAAALLRFPIRGGQWG